MTEKELQKQQEMLGKIVIGVEALNESLESIKEILINIGDKIGAAARDQINVDGDKK